MIFVFSDTMLSASTDSPVQPIPACSSMRIFDKIQSLFYSIPQGIIPQGRVKHVAVSRNATQGQIDVAILIHPEDFKKLLVEKKDTDEYVITPSVVDGTSTILGVPILHERASAFSSRSDDLFKHLGAPVDCGFPPANS